MEDSSEKNYLNQVSPFWMYGDYSFLENLLFCLTQKHSKKKKIGLAIVEGLDYKMP